MFFNKEYSNYLKDVMEKNEDKIHSFNYKYIHDDLLNRRIDETDYSIRAKVSNVIDHINKKLHATLLYKHEISDYIYDIIRHLLRSELQFNIDKFTDERYFINIIMASFFEHYSFKWDDDSDNFKEQINYSKDFLSNLFDILYDHGESLFSGFDYKSNLELKESTKNNINLLFDIIVDSTLKGYKRSDVSIIIFDYSEMEFNNLKFELLSKYHKEKAIEEIENNSHNSNEEIYNKESREILKTSFSEKELIRIFNELVKNKYISCDLELFLSCFGYSEDKEGKIIWKSTKVEFEIFISEIIQKEENPVNKAICFPRKKINYWFMDKNSNSIEAVRNINCDEKSYPIYKIIHP